jgi:hypothetical protein
MISLRTAGVMGTPDGLTNAHVLLSLLPLAPEEGIHNMWPLRRWRTVRMTILLDLFLLLLLHPAQVFLVGFVVMLAIILPMITCHCMRTVALSRALRRNQHTQAGSPC